MIFILTKQRISGFCPEYVIVLRTPQKHLISLDCNIYCTPFLSPYHQKDRNFFFVRSFAVKHCRYYCKHRPYYCYQKPNHHLHSFYFFFQALPPQKCFDFGPTTFYKHFTHLVNILFPCETKQIYHNFYVLLDFDPQEHGVTLHMILDTYEIYTSTHHVDIYITKL